MSKYCKCNYKVKGNLQVKCNLHVDGKIKASEIDAKLAKVNGLELRDQVTQPAQPGPNVSLLYVQKNSTDANQLLLVDNDTSAPNAPVTYEIEKKPLNPFHGWWQAITSGNVFGFDPANAEVITDVDQYIFIDTTAKPYITIDTVYGTLQQPRQPNNNDPPSPVRQFYQPDANSLVHIYDLNGPEPNPFIYYSVPTLTLQGEGILAAMPYSQPYYGGTSDGAMNIMLYQKIDKPPVPIRPFNNADRAFPDYNNPLVLAGYVKDLWNTLLNRNTNINLMDPDYVGFRNELKYFREFFETGFEKTTPIRQIRVSTTIPNALGYTDVLTDIYTGDPVANTGEFSFSTPGSTVIISGLTGILAALNGIYVNGVAAHEAGAIPDPNSNFLDSGANGSFNDIFNHFLLNFDSTGSIFQSAADPTTKFITANPGATVRVRHLFRGDMEYPEFYAAYEAMFYAIFQTDVHLADVVYTPPNSTLLYDTWDDLQTALATNAASVYIPYYRFGQPDPFSYYSNTNFTGFGPYSFNGPIANQSYNDPYGLSPNVAQFNYNVDLANYVINPQNLYFAIQGTLQADQPDPVATFGYLPIIPGPNRASFVGAIGPITVTNGIPTPNNPDPTYYTLLQLPGATSETQASNNAYFGQINPAFTGGKVVGYLFLAACLFSDPFGLMGTGLYSPDSPSNPGPRSSREAYSQVYSVMMNYFNNLGCESIIIDIRTNIGGFNFVPLALAEFFGADRDFTYYYSQLADDGFSPLIDPANYTTYNDFAIQYEQLQGKCYVSLNQSKYPGSVFQGSKLVLVDDQWAGSAGDYFPWPFCGANVDKNIGGGVTVSFIGSLDGRLKDDAYNPCSFPVDSPPTSFLKDPDGNPVSPFLYRMGFSACTFQVGPYTMHQQPPGLAPSKAPTLTGTAGGNPLPMSFQTTVYYDFGFIVPDPYPPIPGWTAGTPVGQPDPNDQTTWRDSILEQAILQGASMMTNDRVEIREASKINPKWKAPSGKSEIIKSQRPINKSMISIKEKLNQMRKELNKIHMQKLERGELIRNKNGKLEKTKAFKLFSFKNLMKQNLLL